MTINLTKEQISLVNNMINVELHYSQETVYDKGELKRLKKVFDMPVVMPMLLCINNVDWHNSLTIGEKYTVILENEDCYLISDNYNNANWFFKNRFKFVEAQ